jgi:putative thioredoxin
MFPEFSAMTTSLNILDDTEHDFERNVVEASFETPIVVAFWAPWFGPRKTLLSLLSDIVNEAQGGMKLAKVNSDEEPSLAGSCAVRSFPTVVIYTNGTLVDGFADPQPEEAIR